MGLPKLPCCPGARARPPPEISAGARSPRTEPIALEGRGGATGRRGAPSSAVKVAARSQTSCEARRGSRQRMAAEIAGDTAEIAGDTAGIAGDTAEIAGDGMS